MDDIATFIERVIPWISTLIVLGGLILAVSRWLFGEKQSTRSQQRKNESDTYENLIHVVDELSGKLANQAETQTIIEDLRARVSVFEAKQRTWEEERADLVDRNIELAKNFGVMSRNFKEVERLNDKLRTCVYANSAEVRRLGGIPIPLKE